MNIKLKLLILVFIVLSLFIYLYFNETRQIKEHFSSLDPMKYTIMRHIDGMGKDHTNSNFLKYPREAEAYHYDSGRNVLPSKLL